MAFAIRWAPSARLDIRELAAYIAESRPQASAHFITQVFLAVERLADFPESGRVVPEFGDPGLREIIRRPCRIVYRIRTQEGLVEIVRVWHAARGIPQL
ncbi:MAG: type II toxin-antitoxin system RelE/ParE family toxin [Solirubrobacterales bacterium]